MLVSAAINDISVDVWLHFRHIFYALDISLSRNQKRKEWYFNIIYIKLPRPKQPNTPPIPRTGQATSIPRSRHNSHDRRILPSFITCLWILSRPISEKDWQKITVILSNFCNSKKELFFISEIWRAKAPDTKECHTKTLRFCLSKSLCERSLRKLVKKPQKPIAGICFKRVRWAGHYGWGRGQNTKARMTWMGWTDG